MKYNNNTYNRNGRTSIRHLLGSSMIKDTIVTENNNNEEKKKTKKRDDYSFGKRLMFENGSDDSLFFFNTLKKKIPELSIECFNFYSSIPDT